MQTPRDPPPKESAPVPARRTFSTHELEAVIRRAVELQATGRGDEGVSEAEVVRIGRELGLEPAAVRRAMAEVRGAGPEERGALARLMGPGSARAARVVERPAASTTSQVDRYLREKELMVARRRFPDRTRYVRDDSLGAGLARFTRGFSGEPPAIDLRQVDVAVSALEADSALVEVGADLSGARTGLAAGAVAVGGSLGAGLAVAVWVTPVADPLMLLGLPAFAATWAGMRAIYGAVRRSVGEKLESFLDRVQHDELGLDRPG